ncbi:unnamed protein product (macronuclear) [Paramecium tetraurelia]|uniref:Rhodanese domain-containing protein n=1 Tax=Paramecium tetraurelia TaxID=5888 RepID=A0DS29_PARTE|nr:uncharacterized protein GSPATT00019550001 [Paramecium tetraurelia]CAK85846.1 unnamed protein product [Paramecium tetraurelia]|eukprot:XP_001453243.1 hypothetical protein (macronuclear) [Paramecium tetraurelia strain d4-2]
MNACTATPAYVNTQKAQQSGENFFIQQFQVSCLGQFSYYIESNNEAAIIDPMRDYEDYIKFSESRNSVIKYVILTHLHADFVAGHLDLAKITGAQIVLGPQAVTQYQAKIAQDEELLPLGRAYLRVVHTPGHTLESSCFVLVVDDKDHVVFSGDSLFLEEVGRPDLASKSSGLTTHQLASLLYHSLRNKIMKLEDDVILYPGHGAGSSCGKAIGAGTVSTIGEQKLKNWALQNITEEEFVKISTDIPAPPQYFFHDVQLNRQGANDLLNIKSKVTKPLSYQEFAQVAADGALILDSRDVVNKGIIKGSINITQVATLASFVGILFKPDQRIVIVADEGKEEITIIRLLRIGYENILGYLEGGFDNYVRNGGEVQQLNIVDLKDFLDTKDQPQNHVFIDCRNPPEFKTTGIVPGSLMIPLFQIENQLDLIPKDKTLHIYCRSGARAKTAATILLRHGYSDFVLIQNAGLEHIVKEHQIQVQKVE